MTKWYVGLTVALGIAVAVFVLGAAVAFRGGISARTEPSGAEARVARAVRSFAIPGEAKARQNPIPASDAVVADGLAHFADHCASCHGNDGSGQTELGRRLYPRAPDLRKPPTQELTDGELFYIIENGVRFTGMPGWGGAGHDAASWGLVRFIRHLTRLTPQEKAQMERLNPRSAEEWRELQEDDAFLGEGGDTANDAPGHAHH